MTRSTARYRPGDPTRTSAAMTAETEGALRAHLLRSDRQEDICLATYRPSTGTTRRTALLRQVHLQYLLSTHTLDHLNAASRPACPVEALTGFGDQAIRMTGPHPAAERER